MKPQYQIGVSSDTAGPTDLETAKIVCASLGIVIAEQVDEDVFNAELPECLEIVLGTGGSFQIQYWFDDSGLYYDINGEGVPA